MRASDGSGIVGGGVNTRTGVVIVGAGFGGLGMGIRLKQLGLNDFVITRKVEFGRRRLARKLLSGRRL